MVSQPFYKRILNLFDPGTKNDALTVVADPNVRRVNLNVTNVGTYGTEIQAGYIYEEYLRKMTGHERAKEFDRVRRMDYQAKMCLSAVKYPILAGCWEIEAFDDSPEAIADKELVEHILFHDLGCSFKKKLKEILTICEFGYAPFEITHKVVENHPKFGSYIGLKNLAWRSPKTIHRFNVEMGSGKLQSITQYAYGDLQSLVDIPAEWLLLFNIDQEGANYEGIPLLRAAYGSHRRKEVYLKLNAIGIEKFAVPTPIATVPSGKQDTVEFTNMIEALKKYTNHQANYLTMPDGWKIELNNNAYDPEKVESSIDNEDKRMTKAFLANFLELGMNSVGSYALSNDLSDFFLGGLEYIADEVKEPFNDKLIPHLIQMNRGPREGYPKLKSSGISDKIGKELAEVVSMFIKDQVIVPDDLFEDSMRNRLKLPKKSDIGKREPIQQSKPSFGGQFQEEPTLAQRIKLAEETRQKRKELLGEDPGIELNRKILGAIEGLKPEFKIEVNSGALNVQPSPAPNVTLNVEKTKGSKKTVHRDIKGLISHITEEEII